MVDAVCFEPLEQRVAVPRLDDRRDRLRPGRVRLPDDAQAEECRRRLADPRTVLMGLAPVVGIPLPLVSFGSSAVMTVMICLGLLMGFERQQRTRSSLS